MSVRTLPSSIVVSVPMATVAAEGDWDFGDEASGSYPGREQRHSVLSSTQGCSGGQGGQLLIMF